MLIIALPHSANASAGYPHVHTDGHSVLRHATGAAATLSAHAGEVVAVVPHSRLAWLRVQLPPASHGARLQSVLQGLLEDRLLDDPQHLHLVLAPDAQHTARTGGDTLVATCNKTWLREALAPLHAAGLVVQRIVPELSPSDAPVLHVMGEPDHAQSVVCHPHGVTLLPPNTAQWHAFGELKLTDASLYAEPAMVTRVQNTLQRQPVLQSAAQRWVQSSQSAWDLAQGEWAQTHRQRAQRQLQALWQNLRHAPTYQALRWGMVAWLALQALMVAWSPVPIPQSRADLEPLLVALAPVLPQASSAQQLDFVNHTLRVQGVTIDTASPHIARLAEQGLRLSADGADTWVLQGAASVASTGEALSRDTAWQRLQNLSPAAGMALTPQAAHVLVDLQQLPAATLAQWLTQARSQAQALPIEAHLTRSPSADAAWQGTLLLRLPGTAP